MSEHRVLARGQLAAGGPQASRPGRWIELDGRPVIPVVAGMDFTRVPRGQWAASVRRIREAGATAVATTVIWSHHCPEPGPADFSGRLDLGGFARLARTEGLGLVLRLGHHRHGGARHGGLPGWLLALPVQVRTDDPGYLAELARWFDAVAAQVDGVPLLGVQFDAVASPTGHLASLRRLAETAGLAPQVWLATGTPLPDGFLAVQEALPEAYWVGAGTDGFISDGYRAGIASAITEVGAGMVSAAHRRVHVPAVDVAALSLTRLAAGSCWQGYSHFHDGRNPRRGLHESHAAGSPNDLPELDVDAGAPLGVDGHRGEAWYRLRLQHLLLSTWGHRLATMPTSLPSEPDPRVAVRCDGASGFLFVTNHRPRRRGSPLRAARFVVETVAGEVAFPIREVPEGTCSVWPFGMGVGDAELAWATAQPVTEVEWRDRPLLVLATTTGIEADLAWRRGEPRRMPTSGPGEFGEVVEGGSVLARWVVLKEPDAWRFGLADGLELTAEGLADHGVGRPLPASVATNVLRHARTPSPPGRGPLGRLSVPTDWSAAARVALRLPPAPGASLVLDWVGDAARLWAGDRLVADSLYTGREWRIGAPDLFGTTDLVAEFVRLHPDAAVHLPDGRPRGARLNNARLELP